MTWTSTEQRYIVALEDKINTLSTAIDNLATRRELKALLYVLTEKLDALEREITQVALTGSSFEEEDHEVDPNTHTNLITYFPKDDFVHESAGTANAGDPVILNSSGLIDESMLEIDEEFAAHIEDLTIHFTEASIDHGSIDGLDDDDHTQYFNTTRGDLRYAPLAEGVTNGDSHDHSGGDGAQIDHGGLAGLADDDHSQYSLVNGNRSFTGTVGGITPVADTDLSTKKYVDDAVTEVIYAPNSITVTTGTYSAGDVDSVTTLCDDDTYDVDEVSGIPGFDIRFNYTSVVEFNRVWFHLTYTPASSHIPQIEVYNYDTSDWDIVDSFTARADIQFIEVVIPDDENYIDESGNAIVRIYHNESGNPTHSILIDYAAIVKAGFGTIKEHGSLQGLEDDDHIQYHNDTRGDLRYAPLAKGVTNGDSHDHSGGDGAQIDHGGLAGLSDDDHSQYHNDTRGDLRYAPIAKGVTNGDSHDHNGGDGAQVDHGNLAGLTDDDHSQYVLVAGTRNITGTQRFNKQAYSYLGTTSIPTGTTQTIDWENGNNQTLSLASASGDVTLTLSNPVTGGHYTIKVIQHAGTARNITWPAACKWPAGVTPTITVTLDSRDLITLFYDGTNYYCAALQAMA